MANIYEVVKLRNQRPIPTAKEVVQDAQAVVKDRPAREIPKATDIFTENMREELKSTKKKKEQAEVTAQKSQELVNLIDGPNQSEKDLRAAKKKVSDLEFLISDRKSDLAIRKGARDEKKDDIAEMKKLLEEATLKSAEAERKHQRAKQDRDGYLFNNIDLSSPNGSVAATKAAEKQVRGKAATDRVGAANVTVDASKQAQELAEYELGVATSKLDVRHQALQDKYAKLVPNGAKKLKAIDDADTELQTARDVFAAKKGDFDNFVAQARGDLQPAGQSEAFAAFQAANSELLEAEKAVTDWKGDQKGRDDLEKKRDGLKQAVDVARKNNQLFVDAGAGKLTPLTDREAAIRDDLDRYVTALKTAPDDKKGALEKAIAENEADLEQVIQLQLVAKRAQKIQTAGIPEANAAHEEAQGKRDDALKEVMAVRAARKKLEAMIEFSKDDQKTIDEENAKIKDRQVGIANKKAEISKFEEELASASADKKPAIQKKLEFAQNQLGNFEKDLKENFEFVARIRESFEKKLIEKKKISKELQEALATVRQKEQTADKTYQDARAVAVTKKREADQLIQQTTAEDRDDLAAARKRFTTADELSEALNADFENDVSKHPELQEAAKAIEDVKGEVTKASDAQEQALAEYAAAEQESVTAEFLEQAQKDAEQDAATFEPFKHLKDADFEKVLRSKGGSAGSELDLFPKKPPKLADGASEKQKSEHNAAVEKYNQESAAVTENLRKAQEAMERMLARDEILEKSGASYEDRKRAFGDMPPALLPPKFREELKAYRDVEECFKREEEQERLEALAKGEMKNSILKDLKGLAEVAGPVVELFIDASGVANNFIPTPPELEADATEQQRAASEAAELLKAKFEITRMIAEGIESFMNAKEGFDTGKEAAEELVPPKDAKKREEWEMRKKMKKDEETAELLGHMKDFLVTAVKQGSGALSMVKGGMSLVHNTGGAASLAQAVPILNVIVNGIDTAQAVYDAGKQIKMAHLENTIHKASKASDDEDALVNSYQNQSNRATNRAVKKSIHATSKGIQTAGSAMIAGGVSGHAGAATFAAGKGVEYANKGVFKCIDWGQASTAKKTLALARAGSFEAMTEIFADHQKYATMYIVMKAVEGDAKAMKFCGTRGLKDNFLDSQTSLALLTKELKIARQEMLAEVDQEDQMNTFKEDVSETWEKVVRGGKALGQIGKMAAQATDTVMLGGAGGKAVDLVKKQVEEMKAKKADLKAIPEPPNAIKPMNAEGFATLLAHVKTIADKAQNGEPITEKDVQFRASWLKHVQALVGTLDKDGDWTEPEFKKEGGKTARLRINEAFAALQALPTKPT